MVTYDLKKPQANGYLFAFLFCISSAISSFYIQKTNQITEPMLSLFLSSATCIIFLNAVNYKSLTHFYLKLNENKSNFFTINFTTAVNWISTFLALKYISPILFISIFMGLLPIASYTFKSCLQKTKLELKILGISFSILTVLLLIAWMEKSHQAIVEKNNFYIGIIFTIISSVFGAFYMHFSRVTGDKLGLNASQILSARFYLVLIVAFILSAYNAHFSQLNPTIILDSMLLAALSSMLPLYCVQKSIMSIGPVKTSFIVPFTPVCTYSISLILRKPLHPWLLPLIIVLSTALFYQSWLATKGKVDEPCG